MKNFVRPLLAGLLIVTAAFGALAQYRGAPVKRERLIKALRSKQLQTRDIVAVINSNGVDFALTPEARSALVAAGARPEVIRAVAANLRTPLRNDVLSAKNERRKLPKTTLPPDYDELLDQAMQSYKERKDARKAVNYLETAVRLNPRKPEAYQLLGFVNLYGLNDAAQAEKRMREAFDNGGSAVFRVYHDDGKDFTRRCTGSLYISADTIRFESDDNRHTFETTTVNVDKLKVDTESNRQWKNYPVFRLFLRIGKDKADFRFAPVSGRADETRMVERFVYVSKNKITFAGLEPVFPRRP
ncbi:MAG: hypothetical protein JSS81_28775 [Acidobacteria bacterium]|nr:hypothetical protein [Acidobacteriota bacterium]